MCRWPPTPRRPCPRSSKRCDRRYATIASRRSRRVASRRRIPLLAVSHNNRGYHQEVMHVQRMSNFRNRVVNTGKDMGPVGTSIQNPDIDYRKLAESMGWWAKGPIKDPSELGPALKEAVAMVKAGQPALLDVWTQPR